jgi:DNA-entry nuclease
MEAYSLEDKGEGVNFNIFCYNIQPGIKIDYKTGKTEEKKDPTKDMDLTHSFGAVTVK